jgi:hypothetical protein
MGQDIHFYVEVRDDLGVWHLAPEHWRTCPSCSGTQLDSYWKVCAHCLASPDEHDAESGRCPSSPTRLHAIPAHCRNHCREGKAVAETFYDDRDYVLFAVLKGRTDSDGRVLAVGDRGMPPDVCSDLAGMETDPNLHSHTHCTLEELLTYPWEENEFEKFARTVAKMQKLHPDPKRVRAVFCYDN